MGDNNPTDYFWHSETNKSFTARCHIETGNSWLRFGFDSDLGRIELPQENHGNPIFIVLDNGTRVSVRGAVTIQAQDTEQMGTVTFTPQEEAVTEWHWTLTRDGKTFTEEGRGTFRLDEPKPATGSRPRKSAVSKRPVSKKKPASKKVARNKKPASRKKVASKTKVASRKPVSKKKVASKKKPATKKKQARRGRSSKR